MDTVRDFEDMLIAMHKHEVRYLIVGGMAFIFHAKPRFTKDIDLWVEPAAANIHRANLALAEFGSPLLLDAGKKDQVVQVGLPPNRIDLIQSIEGMTFEDAWKKRDRGPYGKVTATWIDLDGLLAIKASIDDPRHQSDARYLLKVREMRAGKARKPARVGRSAHGVEQRASEASRVNNRKNDGTATKREESDRAFQGVSDRLDHGLNE